MRVWSQRVSLGAGLSAGMILLAGCQQVSQLKVLFIKRPSETMPTYQPVDVKFLNQNWSAEQRQRFYHTNQGTEIMPYKWFLALEQPGIKVFGTVPKVTDGDYLARFGFLPNAVDANNPDGLPVGFAKADTVDPHSGVSVQVVGITCAACHTGQLNYQGKGVRIDGGSAGIDPTAFQNEVGYAVAFTDKIPGRFGRFATRVLGENASDEDKKKLRAELRAFISSGVDEAMLDHGSQAVCAGGVRADGCAGADRQLCLWARSWTYR